MRRIPAAVALYLFLDLRLRRDAQLAVAVYKLNNTRSILFDFPRSKISSRRLNSKVRRAIQFRHRIISSDRKSSDFCCLSIL